jgi:hypothetical protein
MMALSKNSTSIYFGTRHICKKHEATIDLQHLETCDQFAYDQSLRGLIDRLRAENIRDWEPDR